jgi:hypothetical protein
VHARLVAGRTDLPREPGLLEKLAIIRRHLELLIRYRGETEAVRCMQSRISWYGKTMGHVKPLKEACRLASSVGEIRSALDSWSELVERLGLVAEPSMPASPTGSVVREAATAAG